MCVCVCLCVSVCVCVSVCACCRPHMSTSGRWDASYRTRFSERSPAPAAVSLRDARTHTLVAAVSHSGTHTHTRCCCPAAVGRFIAWDKRTTAVEQRGITFGPHGEWNTFYPLIDGVDFNLSFFSPLPHQLCGVCRLFIGFKSGIRRNMRKGVCVVRVVDSVYCWF